MMWHTRTGVLGTRSLALSLVTVALTASVCLGQPTTVSYQGELRKDGVRFDGNAGFKFALVGPGGSPSYWSNDGTSVNGSQPTASVSLTVATGVFAVQLGASPMVALDASVVNTVSNASLRVWVNSGSGFEQLSDQPLSSSPFSLHSSSADGAGSDFNVPDGFVKVGTGAVGMVPAGLGLPDRVVTTDVTNILSLGKAAPTVISTGTFDQVKCGIGTLVPTRTLDVNGTAQVRGGDLLVDSVTNPGRTYRIQSSGRQEIRGTNDLVTFSGANTLFVTGANFLIDYQTEGNRKFVLEGSTGNVGIGTTTPARRLEVSGRVRITNPAVNLPTGGTLNLTVDANGDLFTQAGGLSLPFAGTSGTLATGGACCQHGVFEIQSTGSGASAGPAIAGCVNTGLGGTPGVLGCGQSPGTVGVKGDGNNGNGGIGVWGDAGYGIGVQGLATGSVPATVTPVGVYGKASDPGNANPSFNGGIGVKGEEPVASRNNCSKAWAGYFLGDVVLTGDLCATSGSICSSGGFLTCSDQRYKKNVTPVASASSKLARLRGVSFDWKRDEFPDQHFSKDRQVGFIAQEVQAVLPEAVSKGSDGYLSVDYSRLTPVLVEAGKEQQKEIETIKAENAALRHELEQIKAALAQSGIVKPSAVR